MPSGKDTFRNCGMPKDNSPTFIFRINMLFVADVAV